MIALVRDTAPSPRPLRRAEIANGLRRVGVRVRDARALPGTRLGFWVHFVNTAAWATLALLWGHPYLVEGVHFSDSGASRLLMVSVIVAGVANPVVGVVTGRWPATRIPFSIGICAVSIAGLTALAAWPGTAPPQALAAAVFVLVMLGGPASMVAFAIARDYNPPHTLGTASGVVNVAGFLATVVATVLFGAVLDVAGGSTPHTMRLALVVLVAVEVLGGWRLTVWYRRVRAQARRRQAAGEPVPVRVGPRLWFDIRELEGPVVTPDELREAESLSAGNGRPG